MPAMPALFHHQNAHPVAHNYSICELDDLDPYVALQTFQSDGCLPTQRDEKGAIRRRYSLRATEAFTCDDFRMYEYKVRRCMRGRSHDWTDCPFAHPGEKARRRDPRKVHYSGSPCPEFRKGSCRRGDACEFAHGVFECYLHPARYRTQACKDGRRCGRRVCFFAHTIQELRHVAVPTEDSFAENDCMVDTHTHEMRPSHMVSLKDGSSVVVLEERFPVVADLIEDLSLQSEYANVGNLCEVLSVLTLPSHDVVRPSEVVSTLGFPTEVELLSDVVPMLHPPSPNALGMAHRKSGASFLMGALLQNNSVSCMPALISPKFDSHRYTPYLGGLSSPERHATLEPSYLDRSTLQETAKLNAMLMPEGFDGGGESLLHARAKEFSDMVQSVGFARGETMQHGCLDGFGSGDYVVNEVESVNTQLAAFGKEMYEFSSYNGYGTYALPSPTSTLAGPLCSPSCSSTPLSSPPLSPQSTPSSDSTSTSFVQGGHNLLGDNTSCKGDVFTQNRHHVKEFRIDTTFADQQSLHDRHHSWQYKWSPLCDYWNPNNTIKCDILQHTFSDAPDNTCGEFRVESPAENAIPDLGWVNELVM